MGVVFLALVILDHARHNRCKQILLLSSITMARIMPTYPLASLYSGIPRQHRVHVYVCMKYSQPCVNVAVLQDSAGDTIQLVSNMSGNVKFNKLCEGAKWRR